MATLDVGLFEHISFIFPFLLVWAMVFGLLSWKKVFGDNRTIHGIIAVAISIMFIMSGNAVAILNLASPWFVILFMFIIFVLMAFKIFGVSDDHIISIVTSKDYQHISTWIILISLVIIVLAGSSVMGQDLLDKNIGEGEVVSTTGAGGDVGSADHQEAWTSTVFHPKVLGFLVVMLIASFTVMQLAKIPGAQ